MNVFRAALSRDFWITGVAIARYLPQAFRTKQIDGNLFFTEQKRQESRLALRQRIENWSLTVKHARYYWLLLAQTQAPQASVSLALTPQNPSWSIEIARRHPLDGLAVRRPSWGSAL